LGQCFAVGLRSEQDVMLRISELAAMSHEDLQPDYDVSLLVVAAHRRAPFLKILAWAGAATHAGSLLLNSH
jgi:hypothetical protein